MTSQRCLPMLKVKILKGFLILLMSCESSHKIDVQGHRGCRGLLPENTLPAFAKAIDLGVHTLELDIAITKDLLVVVSHEPYMNPEICFLPIGDSIGSQEGKHYNLYEMTYEEIKAFDCGTKFHPRFPQQEKLKVSKPLLSDVFDLAKEKNSDAKFNIEIKSLPEYYGKYTPFPKEYVKLVLKVIDNSGLGSRVNLQSFDNAILEEIKKQMPIMSVALLVDENESIEEKQSQLSFKPEIISPYYKLLNKDVVAKLQSNDQTVIPWTVNTKADMQTMIDFQVDGIITDYPDILLKFF